jgi:hypothetical protein
MGIPSYEEMIKDPSIIGKITGGSSFSASTEKEIEPNAALYTSDVP